MVKRLISLLALCLFRLVPVQAQIIDDIQFFNQPIADILLALSIEGDITVIPDETVEGNASFQSQGMDVRDAIELFLKSERLYGTWEDNVLFVSRIRIEEGDHGEISLDAEDAPVQDIVLMLSRNISKSIVYDALPRDRVTLHVENSSLDSILEMLLKQFPDYAMTVDDNYFYINHQIVSNSGGIAGMLDRNAIVREDDGYSLNIARQSRFLNVIKRLFSLAEAEYSYLGRNDTVLSEMEFSSRSFDEILRLVLDQGNCDYTVVGDVYYIYDIQRNEVLQRYNATVLRELKNIDVKQAGALIPQGLLRSTLLSADERRNALILFGTLETLGPLQEFINLIDVPSLERIWKRYDLDYLKPAFIATILPSELKTIVLNPVPDTSSMLVSALAEQHDSLDAWLKVADLPTEGYPVKLRYISSEELLKNLPPSFSEEDIRRTQNPNLVFFLGSREKLNVFKEALKSMDTPIPQIRYDLLVIQYQDNQTLDWGTDLSMKPTSDAPGMSVQGNLLPVTDLKFDLVSVFGYQFALQLGLKLTESQAKVVADSTLNGLSGEKLIFRNTSTYRYRDTKVDTNGNVVLTSEQEITSGLFIDIEGKVSGDNMVTMNIQTTISKQMATDGIDENNLPPTSEKRIDTHIRTEAGRPVIIGGLTQQELVKTIKKTPFFGDIPLLKWLFRSEENTMVNTEFVVYIIPHIDFDWDFQTDNGRLFEHVYERYIEL